MKTTLKLIFLSTFLFVLSSCQEKQYLTGLWEGDGVSLTIVKEGDMYYIRCSADYLTTEFLEGEYWGKFEDSEIKTGNNETGNILYLEERDQLFFGGITFNRVNF
jgi:hypothetical protein